MASTRTKITILVDNNTLKQGDETAAAPSGLASEHGLSFWIESGGEHLLLDTGAGRCLKANVPILGVDLVETHKLVLSHGHYDHSGGLPYALRHARQAHVYCHPSVLQTRYSIRGGQTESVGMPRGAKKALRDLPPGTIRWVLGPARLSETMGVTGPIPRLTEYEDTGGPFYLDRTAWRPDPLEDDLALWIRTGKGLVVCLGCAHSGVVNTLDYVARLNQGEKILAVIGGLHLVSAGEERLKKTADALRAWKLPVVVACHCTGAAALEALKDTLGDSLSQGVSGLVLDF